MTSSRKLAIVAAVAVFVPNATYGFVAPSASSRLIAGQSVFSLSNDRRSKSTLPAKISPPFANSLRARAAESRLGMSDAAVPDGEEKKGFWKKVRVAALLLKISHGSVLSVLPY